MPCYLNLIFKVTVSQHDLESLLYNMMPSYLNLMYKATVCQHDL